MAVGWSTEWAMNLICIWSSVCWAWREWRILDTMIPWFALVGQLPGAGLLAFAMWLLCDSQPYWSNWGGSRGKKQCWSLLLRSPLRSLLLKSTSKESVSPYRIVLLPFSEYGGPGIVADVAGCSIPDGVTSLPCCKVPHQIQCSPCLRSPGIHEAVTSLSLGQKNIIIGKDVSRLYSTGGSGGRG